MPTTRARGNSRARQSPRVCHLVADVLYMYIVDFMLILMRVLSATRVAVTRRAVNGNMRAEVLEE